jgi:hypothetical protein
MHGKRILSFQHALRRFVRAYVRQAASSSGTNPISVMLTPLNCEVSNAENPVQVIS